MRWFSIVRTGWCLACWIGIPALPALSDSVDVVYYHLDDGMGAVAKDNSGKGYDAALHNAPAWVAGKVGSGAVTLNGTSQYVSLPAAATAARRRFAIEFWVKTVESGTSDVAWQRPTLIGQATPGAHSGDFGITTNNGFIGFWTGLSAAGDGSYLSTKTRINDDQWHFIMLINDASNATLYVDGKIEGSLATGSSLNDSAFWLGALHSPESPGHYHSGTFDELHIYAQSGLASEATGGWIKYPDNPLPSLDFDKYGTIFDITVLKEDNFKMWVSWRTKSCNAFTESADGITWTPPVCVLSPAGPAWEKVINRPSVINHGGLYHMWYTGQENPGQGPSRIGYATSPDGLAWTRKNGGSPVLAKTQNWENPSVMNPNVIWDTEENTYKMWYCGGEDYEPDAIGYATSPDGITWTKRASNPVFAKNPASKWEQVKVAGEQVIKDPWGPTGMKGYLMFYIGYQTVDSATVGMAFSKDGITNWLRYENNPIIRPSKNNGFDASACYKPYAVLVGDKWMLYYNGRNGGPEQIALVTHEGAGLGFPSAAVAIQEKGRTYGRPRAGTFGFAGGKILLPEESASAADISVYNLSGRFDRKAVLKNGTNVGIGNLP